MPGQRVVAFVLLCASVSVCFAQTGEQYFAQGKDAFEQADFAGAYQFFKRAEAKGFATAELYFNLGSTLYKLERWNEAERAFLKASKDEALYAVSALNLGLVAVKTDRNREAARWFKRAADTSQNATVTKLANEMLRRLAAQGRSSPADTGYDSSLVYLNFSLGTEDKTVSVDENAAVGDQRNNYAQLSAYGQYTMLGTSNNGLTVTGNLYALVNDEQTDADLNIFDIGLERTITPAQATSFFTGNFERMYLAGEGYQQTFLAGYRIKRPYGQTTAELSYKLGWVDSLDPTYDYLKGSEHRIRAAVSRKMAATKLRAIYEFEFNDRDDLRSASTFTSYSPTRHLFRVSADTPLTDRLRFKPKVDYRTTKYNDANVTPTSSVTREEDRWRVIAALEYSFSKHGALVADYQYTDNSANVSTYDYARHEFTVGVEFLY